MNPTGHRIVRTRLLVNGCRKVRLRLEASIAQSRALRARAAGLIERAGCATDASRRSQDRKRRCER